MKYVLTIGALCVALGAVACSSDPGDDLLSGGGAPASTTGEATVDKNDAGSQSQPSTPSESDPDAGSQEPPTDPDAGSDAGDPSKPPPAPGSVDDLDDFARAAIDRVLQWVKVKMPYCGGPKGGDDGMACEYPGNKCIRNAAQSNPAWDGYRSDCSGTVSFAWQLPPPGRITLWFAPYDRSMTTEIKVDDLRPGDALNNRSHVVLFGGWANAARTKARILEEYDCNKAAVDRIMPISKNGPTTVMYNGNLFYAIRYDNRPGFTPPPL